MKETLDGCRKGKLIEDNSGSTGKRKRGGHINLKLSSVVTIGGFSDRDHNAAVERRGRFDRAFEEMQTVAHKTLAAAATAIGSLRFDDMAPLLDPEELQDGRLEC